MTIDARSHTILRDAAAVLNEQLGMGNYFPYTVQESKTHPLLGKQNIVGFGYGMKLKDKNVTHVTSIIGFVVRKEPDLAKIDPQFVIDSFIRDRAASLSRVGVARGSIVTDVIGLGDSQLYSSPRIPAMNHVPPTYMGRIPGGAVVSPTSVLPVRRGTLGGWLQDSNGMGIALGCWHVLDGGSGQVGISSISHSIRGPVGTLMGGVVPTTNATSTTLDVAVANLTDADKYADFILDFGEIRGMVALEDLELPIHVWKFGWKTRLTGGVMNWGGPTNFPMPKPYAARVPSVVYNGQLLIAPDPNPDPNKPPNPFCSPGDSGALVMTDDHEVVALLVGADATGMFGVATPISKVIDELNQTLRSPIKRPVKFITYP